MDSSDRFPASGGFLRELAAHAAHDLNNLIAIVGGHVYLLRQPGPGGNESLDATAVAVEQLERLSRSLARLGVLQGADYRPISVNDLARRAARLPGRPALDLELEDPLPSVRGSEADLTSALEALVQNALEASPANGAIRLTTRHDRDAGTILVSVSDSGRGIAPGIAERVFDPFFTTRTGRGAGIGLFLVAVVAAAHGGCCRLENGAGGGTSATLRLPAAPEE